MHRVTKESGLTDSANGSMAKDTERLRSTTKGAATSALTKCAFSWKFVCRNVHLAYTSLLASLLG
jgi:hypothetical protein